MKSTGKTELQEFCNISSVYDHRREELTVRRCHHLSGRVLKQITFGVNRQRFDDIECEMADRFNDGTAIMFNANAAETFLELVGFDIGDF